MIDHVTPRALGQPAPLSQRSTARRKPVSRLAIALVSTLVWLAPVAQAFTRDTPPPAAVATSAATISIVPLSQLPPEGQEVHRRIHDGGPFLYSKDGTVFGNRERLLPRKVRGFYREYTVPTPGLRHRGARRIVCGGEIVHKPETCFYTQDHYQSFQKIDPRR